MHIPDVNNWQKDLISQLKSKCMVSLPGTVSRFPLQVGESGFNNKLERCIARTMTFTMDVLLTLWDQFLLVYACLASKASALPALHNQGGEYLMTLMALEDMLRHGLLAPCII